MARPLVFKFGGACLLQLDDFVTAAAYLRERLGAARQAVAVVSAMSGTSGNLEELVGRLNVEAPLPAAAAIASADQLSAALLAIALAGAGITTCLLPYHATGLTGTGNALRARLTGIDGSPLRTALSAHQIAVLPGGQGVSSEGHLMMLGRNSSDLSAVAAAAAIEAEHCEIFSGLPGIYTADPRLVPSARPLPQVRYDTAAEMARSGAKILHEQAIRLAARRGLQIICRGWPPAVPASTIVAAVGEWHPVVIANARCAAWEFSGRAQARAASRLLAADGIGCITHGRHLIAESGETGLARSAVHRACRLGSLTGLRLLSVLDGEGLPARRRLVPAPDLVPAVREEHQRLYPAARPCAHAADGEHNPRSPFSRVLYQGSDPTAPPGQ